MKTAEIIYKQMGGNRFQAMTGAHHFLADGDSLRMQIPRNGSKANRLTVTLGADDLYTMRFYHYTAGRYNRKTGEWRDDVVTEVAQYEEVYADNLQSIFTQVTGLYTHL